MTSLSKLKVKSMPLMSKGETNYWSPNNKDKIGTG